MKVVVAVVLLLGLAACGGGSLLGDELATKLAKVDEAMRRDPDEGCRKLAGALPELYETVERLPGGKAPELMQVVDRMSELCSLGRGRGHGEWPALYGELQAASTHKTSWLTVFAWVSMFAVGIGVYYALRRLKS